ncbi:hypothetical protein KIH27_01410 [Mycobacterium sp. M1]|uniref:Uncharacterized protein n=1 Tax=Mycolicibacter acidiphilus TaxID=2835306 RepID=A0ABS5RE49_9MYCO|nr:hypothetical protein [Mycolicibacter acidiphilus]MBS9532242.1 hypothetical protein [Mycolicibacter acidiphilus]
MKLARPDIFHPRIVLAGDPLSSGESTGRVDDERLIDALRRRGLHARSLSWDDPDTLDADLVILRAAHREVTSDPGFLAWTTKVRNLLNAPDVVAWNVGAHYLRDLQYAGVPTASGAQSGETTALIFFAGGQSHAFQAGGGTIDSVEPDFELWDLGRTALRAAAERLSIRIDELLYARADVTGPPDDVRLVSLDLVAPQLGWRGLNTAGRDDAQRRFALAVESALDRLRLDPFAHRGP